MVEHAVVDKKTRLWKEKAPPHLVKVLLDGHNRAEVVETPEQRVAMPAFFLRRRKVPLNGGFDCV